jgi:hypothetical protein
VKRHLLVAAAILVLTGCSTATPSAAPTSKPEPSPTSAPQVEATAAPANDRALVDYPILPEISAHAKEIYQAGVAQGHNPQVFSKVGNCMTASPDYLAPFSNTKYDLGEYASLQPTIAYFQAVTISEDGGVKLDSFSNPSQAAASGFTAAGPLDPIWSNPKFCQSGETPLACEYRVTNPSMALILFGTNDVQYLEADKFESYMRSITEQTIKANVVPVLITFPPLPDRLDKTEQYNRIVARIAAENDIPLVNLWRALSDMPGYGVNPEHFTKLTTPADGCAVCFNDTNLKSGITTENLVMLQSLDALRQAFTK